MTTYFRTASGQIVNSHDITRAYNASDKSVPFHDFSRDWLHRHSAKKDPTICTDDLILAGQIHEAILRFKEVYGCSYFHAANAVYWMKDGFRC